jgi:hypothetical protein
MVRRESTDNLDKSLFLRLVVRRAKKDLQMRPFRGVRCQASLYPTRPVTPEVAGSSPVAPVLCSSHFCSDDEDSDYSEPSFLSAFVRFRDVIDRRHSAVAERIPPKASVSVNAPPAEAEELHHSQTGKDLRR